MPPKKGAKGKGPAKKRVKGKGKKGFPLPVVIQPDPDDIIPDENLPEGPRLPRVENLRGARALWADQIDAGLLWGRGWTERQEQVQAQLQAGVPPAVPANVQEVLDNPAVAVPGPSAAVPGLPALNLLTTTAGPYTAVPPTLAALASLLVPTATAGLAVAASGRPGPAFIAAPESSVPIFGVGQGQGPGVQAGAVVQITASNAGAAANAAATTAPAAAGAAKRRLRVYVEDDDDDGDDVNAGQASSGAGANAAEPGPKRRATGQPGPAGQQPLPAQEAPSPVPQAPMQPGVPGAPTAQPTSAAASALRRRVTRRGRPPLPAAAPSSSRPEIPSVHGPSPLSQVTPAPASSSGQQWQPRSPARAQPRLPSGGPPDPDDGGDDGNGPDDDDDGNDDDPEAGDDLPEEEKEGGANSDPDPFGCGARSGFGAGVGAAQAQGQAAAGAAAIANLPPPWVLQLSKAATAAVAAESAVGPKSQAYQPLFSQAQAAAPSSIPRATGQQPGIASLLDDLLGMDKQPQGPFQGKKLPHSLLAPRPAQKQGGRKVSFPGEEGAAAAAAANGAPKLAGSQVKGTTAQEGPVAGNAAVTNLGGELYLAGTVNLGPTMQPRRSSAPVEGNLVLADLGILEVAQVAGAGGASSGLNDDPSDVRAQRVRAYGGYDDDDGFFYEDEDEPWDERGRRRQQRERWAAVSAEEDVDPGESLDAAALGAELEFEGVFPTYCAMGSENWLGSPVATGPLQRGADLVFGLRV